MKFKRLLLGAGIAVLGVSLASCSEKEVRNTVTPYGELNGNLDKIIATANGGKSQMTIGTYYNKLKSMGYDKVSGAIDAQIYAPEIKAITNLYKGTLDKDDKEVLKIQKSRTENENESNDDLLLYPLTDEKLEELRRELYEEINLLVGTKIYGTADYEAIAKKTEAELNKSITSFIDSQRKIGIDIKAEDIKYVTPADPSYKLNKEKKLIQFNQSTLDKLEPAVDAAILEQAKLLSSKKALFQHADDEYIEKTVEENGKDVKKKVKNDFYIFKDSNYEAEYDRTFKTYGTYNAIVIQFNSLKEAQEAIKNNPIDTTSIDTVKESYVKLYNTYYKYKTPGGTTAEDPVHTYVVNEFKDDFNELPSSVASLIKTTLEDNDYLVEPRNVNNKYVLAFRGNTVYEINDSNEETDFDKLDDNKKNELLKEIKEALINSNAKSYQATDYQEKLEDAKLEIYDPYFEYKFEYTNSSIYDHVTTVTKPESNVIFKMEDYEYTVKEFFEEASYSYGSTILIEHFQLDYANAYYNDYVDLHLISKDAQKDNKKALDEAIKTFNSNKNSTYPAEIGLETYLIGAYGYSNKDDILKYYYDAKAALSTYKSILVFDEWATEDNKISDAAKTGILANILAAGNNTYNELFNINLDHLLINIDDNGDGQPDDPEDFFQKNPTIKASFETAVANLAQAIYKEAVNEAYKNNTLFETLTYIKTQYEEGGKMLSETNKTWDQFKKENGNFNFLLTVEQLASNGDITQESVNNFVTPFKDYVKNIYKTASAKENFPKEFDNGTFYIVSGEGDTLAGEQLTTADQASKITSETLCKTNFGYHLLVLNSYDGPKTTDYTKNDDVAGFQNNLQIVLRKYEAEDDKDDETIYVYTDSYNDKNKEASFNQLFIYYVQQANGVDSSLDSDIKQIMSTLFDGAINTYKSSNFQTFLLLDLLKIEVKDVFKEIEALKSFVPADFVGKLGTALNAEIENLQHQITSYDANSPYASWVNTGEGKLDWSRPDVKKEA